MRVEDDQFPGTFRFAGNHELQEREREARRHRKDPCKNACLGINEPDRFLGIAISRSGMAKVPFKNFLVQIRRCFLRLGNYRRLIHCRWW